MPVQRIIVAPYSAEDMFALVDDIESYPRFIPWCESVQVERGDGADENTQQVKARLNIAYKGITTFFTTMNEHTPPQSITMKACEGALSSLRGQWQFIPLGENRCRIEFNLEYTFHQRVLGAVFAAVFNHAFSRFADHFVERAKSLYGDAGKNKIAVEVVDAPNFNRRVILPSGATVNDALQRAGYELTPSLAVGIFGERCELDKPLTAGDRVEIYHPLANDPREARRARAQS